MKFIEFAKQLPTNKRRSVADLSRFVSTRTDENPNYTLLFGAGCSISSDIRSGAALSEIWRDEIYSDELEFKNEYDKDQSAQINYLKQHCSSWYDPSREYSCLFERKFDLQRQRRMFVEAEVADKKPSIGYAYLTALVESNHFGTIFTTNFDDLINEAFYLYSNNRPIVCAHDSSIDSITVTSRRPKIIKLHGDYLFDDIKSTARETESLEQNMKEKFIEFSKDFGLVVVGYSGGDRSIMDLLSVLLKNDDYFKSGIYWCVRSDSEITEELKKLIWKDRVYFVEIDGFDELFAEIYSRTNKGDVLPLGALSVSRRPNEIVAKLLSSPKMFPETNCILKNAKEKLLRQSKRLAIADSIVDPGNDEKYKFESGGLTEDEFFIVTEVQRLISNGAYELAVTSARNQFKTAERKILKRRLLHLIVSAYRHLGNAPMAVGAADELIALQPKNASNYLLKAASSLDMSQKLFEMNRALEVDSYSVKAHLELARHYSRMAGDCYGHDSAENREKAFGLLNNAIKLDPSSSNPAWGELFEEYNSKLCRASDKEERCRNIVNKLSEQNPYSYRVLSLRARLISDKISSNDLQSYIDDVRVAQERHSDDEGCLFYDLKLMALDKACKVSELEKEIESIDGKLEFSQDVDLAIRVAGILRRRFGNDDKAIHVLDQALKKFDFSAIAFSEIFSALCDKKMFEVLDGYITKYGKRLVPQFLSDLMVDYYIGKNDFDAALRERESYTKITGLANISGRTFIMLLKGDNINVEKLSREYLDRFSFTPEAAETIVNFEIARKRLGRKVDNTRLDAVLKQSSSDSVRAAIYGLIGKRNECIAAIREVMKKNMTFRFDAEIWPAFDEIRSDPAFQKEISRRYVSGN